MAILKNILCVLTVLATLASAYPVQAAAPIGADWFQLTASPSTGSDNTGDGGTGLPADLNYYYVGQAFTSAIQISSGGTNAANIWVDYNTANVTASNLTTGAYFPSWSGQTISGGRVKSTGYRTVGQSSGAGSFGTVRWTMVRPTAANYGTGAPLTLDINTGVIGATTESNISLDGNDILDDAEDFRMHIWADTKKPYALNPGPADTTLNVPVESAYTFDLRDSKNGEGDNTGVGTGVNTATPPGVITVNAADYTSWDSYACSGVWGTNLCTTTLNPPSPLSIAGDARNWNYNTAYTVAISGFRDLASPAQNQLGDTNGPNTMDAKTWTFTTEPDSVAPRVVSETPVRGSLNNPVATNITIDVHDKKAYPGNISGTGVVSATCRINVSSPTSPLTTYQQGQPQVTVTAIDYGYRFVINPDSDFDQNEIVTVSAFDCEDVVGNVMVTDTWTFATADTDPPYVDQRTPGDDQNIIPTGTVSFHLKDDGAGVDLASVVVYVNGNYYTNTAGAGFVTVNGTRITYASSTAFTSIAGTPNDYTIDINPAGDFVAGESIPVIIYAKDVSNNVMERDVYSLSIAGGVGQTCGNSSTEGNEVCDDGNVVGGDGCSANCLSTEVCGNSFKELAEQCDDGNVAAGDGCDATCQYEVTPGSTYCAADTTWNGVTCVANCAAAIPGSTYCGAGTSWNGASCTASGGSGSCTGGGGSGGSTNFTPLLSVHDIKAYQVDEDSVLISWLSNVPASSRVVFDTDEHASIGSAPDYGYLNSTAEFANNNTYHAVMVDGLKPGTLYHFRPIIRANGSLAHGEEVKLSPLFATREIEVSVETIQGLPMTCQPIQGGTTPPVVNKAPASKPPVSTVPTQTTTPATPSKPAVEPTWTDGGFLKIHNIEKQEKGIRIEGSSKPKTKLKIFIY